MCLLQRYRLIVCSSFIVCCLLINLSVLSVSLSNIILILLSGSTTPFFSQNRFSFLFVFLTAFHCPHHSAVSIPKVEKKRTKLDKTISVKLNLNEVNSVLVSFYYILSKLLKVFVLLKAKDSFRIICDVTLPGGILTNKQKVIKIFSFAS